ncbi:hypothetical protein [Paenibacillus sp. MMS20-IR301]|uniref:hypothetical protein n=1 Tax=Paenibacillus sp. MMS20-IR301 TaxID=2895946 RepID=UPI0028EFB27B|nr:hypothetical protein [Paenibacillus sp. MMS20-IR301]WNS45086.1 hypothetical protein LOS79_07410 [Paenibacillus sp. MMS20-IR301]
MNPLNDTYYLAITYRVPKEELKAYFRYVRSTIMPFYDSLNDLTASCTIYQHRKTAEQHGKFTVWNMLHLLQLRGKPQAEECLARLDNLERFPAAEMIRKEILFSTPDSNYPEPAPKFRRRWLKPLQIVEYVDVASHALNEFRDIMIAGNGPAMRFILEERQWCQSFTALETAEILCHNERYPGWNQLHIIALYLEAPLRYKRDFGEGLRRSSGVSFAENFARLKKIRHMLYKSVSRRLTR